MDTLVRIQYLKEKAAQLPLLPGVYLMKDKEGSIIYVGKSKHLKKRVSSYFTQSKHHSNKVKRLVKHIWSFEVIETDTELDALLLECDLIKKIKPIYNKLLKEDHKYQYIYLNQEGDIPFFECAYDKDKNRLDALYFGPYNRKYELEEAVQVINTYFKLMQCKGKPNKAFCMPLLGGGCLAPCQESVADQYRKQIDKAINFLNYQTKDIIEHYKKQMIEAAERLEFEKAQEYKRAYELMEMLSYREKVMAWSISSKKCIVFIPCRQKYKVYFLVGSQIIKTLYVNNKRVYPKWNSYFEMPFNNKTALNKEEIDRASIIYTYIYRNKECKVVELV